MKRFLVLSLCLALIVGFTGCNDDDPAAYADVDAYIISKEIVTEGATETVYALGFRTIGNKSFSKVTASGADGTYTLKVSANFAELIGEFSSVRPSALTYTFSLEFQSGETLQKTNAISSSSVVEFVDITHEFDVSGNKAVIEWNKLEGAEAYRVALLDGEENIVYSTAYLNHPTDGYEILPTSSNYYFWADGHPKNGATYTLRVTAYDFESVGGTYDYLWHSISWSDSTIIWGQE